MWQINDILTFFTVCKSFWPHNFFLGEIFPIFSLDSTQHHILHFMIPISNLLKLFFVFFRTYANCLAKHGLHGSKNQ